MTKIEIPPDHPRRISLETREKIIDGHESHVVATAGLLAHGRGEAFDYLIGERTTEQAELAMQAAVAALLSAKHPVISVNGNACSLVPEALVELSEVCKAPLEINLFYYRKEREDAIRDALIDAGAKVVLGTQDRPSMNIPELSSNRRKVDVEGIGAADVVLVPLEDGDRTEALKAIGKFVITIDLNPMSRTAVYSDITIIDNIVRALPRMAEQAHVMKKIPKDELHQIVRSFNNSENIATAVRIIITHLERRVKDIVELRTKTNIGVSEK